MTKAKPTPEADLVPTDAIVVPVPDAAPPLVELDAPVVDADAPPADPDAPVADADAPPADPDAPVADADAPPADPDAPAADADAQPADPDAPVADADAQPAAEPTEVVRTGIFPGPMLALGGRARRASWKDGFTIVASNALGRSGVQMKLMMTGSRAGLIEWKPHNLADELLSTDWEVEITVSALHALRNEA